MYKPVIGKQFPVEVRVIEARTVFIIELARLVLTIALAIIAVTGCLAYIYLRMVGTECSGLETFLGFAVLPTLMMIVGYYFGRNAKKDP